MIEAMKQALEALEIYWGKAEHRRTCEDERQAESAIASLRQAIREHAMYEVQRLGQEIEQEPYGWVSQHTTKGMYEWQFNKKIAGVYQDTAISILPVYTHPPQCTWVGLTDEERDAIEAATLDLHGVPKFFATAIEAKLKEKNTDAGLKTGVGNPGDFV
jgi:hypothetical protein